MLMLFRGEPIPVPSVEKAEAFLWKEGVPPEALPLHRRFIVGTPPQVREEIEAVAASYGAEEVFLVNIVYSHAARMRSYELIARAFGLSGAETGA